MRRQFVDFSLHLRDDGIVVDVFRDTRNVIRDLQHFGLLQAARRDGGRSDADAAGDRRFRGIERDQIHVDGDVRAVQRRRDILSADAFRTEVHQHQMVVRSTADDAETTSRQRIGEAGRVRLDLLLIGLEFVAHGLFKADSLAGDDVHERTALHAWEDFGIHGFKIFLLAENRIGSLLGYTSALSNRIVPLVISANTEEGLYNHLYELYQPEYLWLPESKVEGKEIIFSAWEYCLVKTGNQPTPMYEELSLLLPTSGSTGSPKLVRHSYRNIEANADNVRRLFELDGTEKAMAILPMHYTMGLSVITSHLLAGSTLLLSGRSLLDKGFWAMLKDATSFTGVPYSFEILNLMRFFRMDLPDLTLLTQGGGRMPKELNLKFAEYCRDNGKRWIATYGQSECTARMAWLPPKWAIEKVGSIGMAVPNAELSLIDMDGNPITSPYTEGEMCYRGKNVTMGYARQREDLLLGDERHGFIRTGDLAYFDEDGCYYIVGRMGRFLKLFGMRVGLDECERIVKGKFPGLECACVGTDEKMLVYLTDESHKIQVKEELVNRLKLVASSFEVRIIPEIPKNEAGKILYAKLENR